MDKMEGKKLLAIGMMFLIALSTRLIPHPPSFTGVSAFLITGIFLFRRVAMITALTVLVFFLSDLILNNIIWSSYFDGFALVSPMFKFAALAYILIAGVTALFKKAKLRNYFIAVVFAAIAFFLISNYGVWLMGITYPMTSEGLIACYMAGLPYIGIDIIATILFSAIYYGLYVRITESKWVWQMSRD